MKRSIIQDLISMRLRKNSVIGGANDGSRRAAPEGEAAQNSGSVATVIGRESRDGERSTLSDNIAT